MTLAYDIRQSYQFNYDRGPVFATLASGRGDVSAPMKSFLGLPVRSRLGIAAGLLLNSRWVEGYAKRGYDILTYKTVRSRARPCYEPPNWVFVEEAGSGTEGPVYVCDRLPEDPREISSAVCFGMPSMSPEVWREDVRRARQVLGKGQILIVSVVGTPADDLTPGAVAEDFARCAAWAVEAGADVVEANFSCPNVCTAEGTIYMDPILSQEVAQALRGAMGPSRRLLIKVGHVGETSRLRGLLRCLHGLADGITLVNGITRPVLHRDGRPAFGPDYVKAGVLGRAIHTASVEQVRRAHDLIREDNLRLVIAAVGGVSRTSDMADFFDAGAAAVLMGSSPMYLPELAKEARSVHPEW